MSLTNPNTPVSQKDLQDFYHRILPYMGGNNEGGSGHTIEDAEGTDLTQRDTLQFGEGFLATDNPTNEKTVVDIDSMSAEDMDEIIDELPTGGNIAVTGYVPLGTLISFYGETAPRFFLACDGSIYNKADYPELANHLLSLTNNTSYIVDGDDTKFKVPDLRGEFLRGTGTNSHADQGSGEDVGEHQDATEHIRIGVGNEGKIWQYASSSYDQRKNADSYKGSSTKNYATSNMVAYDQTASVNYYTSRPTNTSVLFCVAYKDIYSNPMNDYSTTEKIVGTWIDGKPLYQKTINCGSVVHDNWVSINHNISNIAMVCDVTGGVINPNTGSINSCGVWGDNKQGLSVRADRTTVGGYLYFPSASNTWLLYITFRYTKTTD